MIDEYQFLHRSIIVCCDQLSGNMITFDASKKRCVTSRAFILDNAQINRSEWSAKKYGPSTAAAALTYKKKRRIINFTYQT